MISKKRCSTEHSHIASRSICVSICMYHDKSSATTHTCTLQISQSHMSNSTTSMRHTQSLVRVQTHDTVTSKLNQPCAHILHVYQCCVQLIRTHFCVYTAYTRNCAPVVLTLNSSISNKIYYITIYHMYIYICRQPLQ